MDFSTLIPSTPIQFPLGQILATPGAIDMFAETFGNHWRREAGVMLARHQAGDWGDINPADRGLNEQSLIDGSRILSVYRLPKRIPGIEPPKVWIITEADRSSTTILLPEEY